MANGNSYNFEADMFKMADKLRKNIDAAEYKNVVLGLIFLKYISDSFNELYVKLKEDEFSDPEDRDEYIAENIFFVPKEARWEVLQAKAKLPEIGVAVDNAMEIIEKENKELKNVLPKVFAKPNLDKTSLGQLIDLISDIELKAEGENSKDLLGKIYEYFLGEFANAEGKKGGQFYTPKSIVQLMVEMIEPYKGRVYDPACGSGGMFVMSEKFVEEHQGNIQDITIYGQESNQTTWKLSKMNLAIRNINSQFVSWNTEGSFLKDAHPDLKADYILANPPFNQKDWGQEILTEDGRFKKYGLPPAGNANFAWIQHMLYHLAFGGVMATVLANGSLSSNTSGEGDIRTNIVKDDLVDCIVALPKQLFYNTGIPATIWILRRGKKVRQGEVLFIDASNMGFMKDRVHREFSDDDIKKITTTYHNWLKSSEYENVNIILPETYDEQKAIADVLSSLDEKIELLQEENKTLEELAQTIFKEWFVNFNFPGATGELEESELGEIPKGWRVYGLNELVDTISGYAYKGKELVEESDKTLVTLKSFNRNGGFQTRGFKPFMGTPKEEQKVVIGDLVVAHTDLTQDAEVLGNPAFIFENAGYKEMYITMDLVKVLSINENIDNSFLYYLMKDSRFKGHCVGCSNGTTVLHLSKKAIPEYRLALSEDLKLAKDFSAVTKELTNKISNNIIQIDTLSKTKETLLPKLMSGEIRVEGFGDAI